LSRKRVVVPARQATQVGGIEALESILGLLKSLKIRALVCNVNIVYGNLKPENSQDLKIMPRPLNEIVRS